MASPGQTLPHEDGRARKPGAPKPRPHLFLALECDRPLAAPARFSLADLSTVTIGRSDARSAIRDGAHQLALRVPDGRMSANHARLSKVLGRWVLEDAVSRNGTLVNGALITKTILQDGDVLELGHTIFLYRDSVPTLSADPPALDAATLSTTPGLATLSLPFSRELVRLDKVARSNVAVVLRGESGTGKEVVARAIHALSSRAGDFVAVNCGALPDTLVESMIFGHKKGSFSGATEDHPGLIRAADRGTLFLDEIGDLPAPSQAAFLRVLQEQEVTPVGASRPIKVDLRLVAATHRDLDSLAADSRFRPDLLARITGFTLTLPPLRERREDLGLLLSALLRRIAPDRADEVTISVEAARALFACPWRLNIRELEKCLGAALVLAGPAAPIELEHLPPSVREPGATPDPIHDLDRPLTDDETRHRDKLVALLKQHDGNVSAVARALGKARMQVHRWVHRYRIGLDSFRR